jgi:hypothetical protein
MRRLAERPAETWSDDDVRFANDIGAKLREAHRTGEGPKRITEADPNVMDAEFTVEIVPYLLVRGGRPGLPPPGTGGVGTGGVGQIPVAGRRALPPPQRKIAYVPIRETRIGKKSIGNQDLPRGLTPEAAIEELKSMIPEVAEYSRFRDNVNAPDINQIKARIQAIANSFDPANTYHAEVVAGADRMLVEINKRGGGKRARETGERIEKASREVGTEGEAPTAEGRVVEEGEGPVRVRDVAEERVEAEVAPIERTPIAKFKREKAGSYLSETETVRITKDGKKWTIKNAESGEVISEGFKTLKDARKAYSDSVTEAISEEVRTTKTRPQDIVLFTKDEVPRFVTISEAESFGKTASPKQVTKLKSLEAEARTKAKDLQAEGKLEEASDLGHDARLYREAIDVATEPSLGDLPPSEGRALIKERVEALKAEGRIGKKAKAAKEAMRSQDDMEAFLKEGKHEKWEYDSKMEEVYEFEERIRDTDISMDDYRLRDVANDVFDILKDERGSFSARKLSPEDIMKIDRLRRKARQMGTSLRRLLKDMGIDAETIKNIDRFVKQYFVDEREAIQAPDPTLRLPGSNIKNFGDEFVLKKGKQRKVGKTIVSYPNYIARYLKGWQGAKDTGMGSFGEQFEPAPRWFDRTPFLKEELYYPYKAAEKLAKVHKKALFDEMREMRKSFTKEQQRKIYDYAISRQEGGVELLKASGRKAVPRLTKEELAAYETFRTKFGELFTAVNDVRTRVGKNPIKGVKDYFTFLRAFSFLEEHGLGGEMIGKSPDVVMKEYARMKATPFRFAKLRKKGAKYKLKDNPFEVFNAYANAALDHVYMSPVVAKGRVMLDGVRDPATGKFNNPQYTHPNTSRYLRRWLHKISGSPMQYDLPPGARRVVNKLNRNLGVSILGASIRSALIQTTALRNTFAELGSKYTAEGVFDLFTPGSYRNAMVKSDVLFPRNFDATIADALGDLKNVRVKDFLKPNNLRKFSMQGLVKLDMITARATWQGAYKKGREVYSLSEKQAARYADDVVTKTQASGAPGDLAPIQYTAWGKALTLFQTFVINDWKFLTQDVLGLGKNTTMAKAMPKLIRYVIGTAMINMLFEDATGIKSPFPRPVKALQKGMENQDHVVDIALGVGKELVEPIPVIGNARYGSSPLGAGAEKISKVFTGGKYGQTPAKEISQLASEGRVPTSTLELVGNLAGVPGTGQVAKSFRAAQRGEAPFDIVMGNYTEPDRRRSGTRKSGRGRRSRR